MRFFKFVLLLFVCLLLSGCGKLNLTTDVQSEEELLSVMRESGKYYFYETFSEQDFLNLFSDIDDESNSGNNLSSDNEASESLEGVKIEYVLNTSSKKFHLPECDSVAKIKEKNISKSFERDAIISSGYIPCKICNP